MDDNKRIKAKEIKLITVFVQYRYTSYIVTFIKFRSVFKKRVAVTSFTQIVRLY